MSWQKCTWCSPLVYLLTSLFHRSFVLPAVYPWHMPCVPFVLHFAPNSQTARVEITARCLNTLYFASLLSSTILGASRVLLRRVRADDVKVARAAASRIQVARLLVHCTCGHPQLFCLRFFVFIVGRRQQQNPFWCCCFPGSGTHQRGGCSGHHSLGNDGWYHRVGARLLEMVSAGAPAQ